MLITEFNNYKKAIREILMQKKQFFPNAFNFQKMADHMQIQKTYLSKVLNQDGNFTSDQLFLACEFLLLNPSESYYLSLLREKENTNLSKRKLSIEKEIQSIQHQSLKTESYLQIESHKKRNHDKTCLGSKNLLNKSSKSSNSNGSHFIDSDSNINNFPAEIANANWLNIYFMDPFAQMVHLALEITVYQKNPSLLKTALGISEERIIKIIKLLIDLQFITWSKDRYQVIKKTLHLSDEAEAYPFYKQLMRQVLNARMEQTEPEDYYFSVLFTADLDTQLKIKQLFLNFLKETQKIVTKSDSKNLFQINFDLKKWI